MTKQFHLGTLIFKGNNLQHCFISIMGSGNNCVLAGVHNCGLRIFVNNQVDAVPLLKN